MEALQARHGETATPTRTGTPTGTPTNAIPAAPTAADGAHETALDGIERLMAEALVAVGGCPGQPCADPASLEYASWLQRLRRATP